MKAIAAFLGLLALILAIALGMSRSEIGKLKASAAANAKVSLEKADTADEQIAALKSRVRSLEHQVPAESASIAAKTAAPGKTPRKRENWMQASRAMMDTPEMQEMMRAQQEAALKVMYGQLLDSLDLPEEVRKKLLDELLATQLANMGAGMKLMDPAITPAERAELQKQLGEGARQSQDRLKEILGQEKYDTFKQYQDSQPERMQLNTMRQRLADAQIPLSADQEQKLMDMMYRERVASTGSPSSPPGSEMGWPAAGADEALKMADLAEQRSTRILDQANGVLSQQQLDVFRATQEDMIRMQRMGAEMMKQMTEPAKSE